MADIDRNAFAAQVTELMPFAKALGMAVVEAAPEKVVATAAWAEDRCTAGGVLHGGFLMAVADSTAAACAFLNLPPGAVTSTIESKTNFLGVVRGGDVTFTSEPVHVGRTTIVVQTDARDERGRLVTRTTQTQAVIAAAT